MYLFLGEALDVLYVGKAGHLRRRIRQHAMAGPPTSHLHGRYDLVRHVRWTVAADEEAAAWREADLIFALRPRFNAESGTRSPRAVGGERRVPYLVVRRRGPDAVHTFRIETRPARGPARTYGCFPHLGKGMSSRLGIACSDGYVAFLRLLWAASSGGPHMPSAVTKSAPELFGTTVDPGHDRRLHAFLSGVSDRLLDDLAEAAAARPAYMRPALARDRDAAARFFAAGPQRLRALRLRHGIRAGVVAPDLYRALVIAEIEDDIVGQPTAG